MGNLAALPNLPVTIDLHGHWALQDKNYKNTLSYKE